ncbi:MAG: prephenate dehydrogenase [Chitinispirillaceae bacterium]|jgi:prephenate dehydrogenase|nr:prephenate dehydrogenase [Chitinispirillaceae bacterium]
MTYSPGQITIYSVGLLGGSIGLSLKNSGYSGRIIGLSSQATLPLALKLGCVDEAYTYDALPEIISSTDLLILCSPISGIIKAINTLACLPLPAKLIVTDVGSTKGAVMKAAAELGAHFIGGHPMAGSDKSGPAAADPYLFQNAIYVLTPGANTNTGPDLTDRNFAGFLEKHLGCRTLFLDPERHDRIVAAVSHLPHLLAVALVNEANAVDAAIPGTLDLAAGGFRDMTRIAGSSYGLWHDILSTNRDAIEPLIDGMIGRLADIKERLQSDTLRDLFEESKKTRLRIPQNAKGFIRQLSEVLVVVKDQPGMIAAIAAALAGKEINISDIEVMKVREGEGGTIRLAFESPALAAKAVGVLTGAGFIARERT